MLNTKHSPFTKKVTAQVSYQGTTYTAAAITESGEKGCFGFWEIYVSSSQFEKVFTVSIPRRTEMTERRVSQHVVGFVFDGRM